MPRPRLHDDALRARLLDEASKAISTTGAAGLTVRDVARAAGTSASAVYALFGGRDELVAAVAAEAWSRFAAHLAAAPRTDDPAADLLSLGLAYRESSVADPHFYNVMFGTDPDPAQAGASVRDRPTFVVLRDAVTRLRASVGAPTSLAADTEAALVLWGLVHGLVALELLDLLPGNAAEREDRYVAALRAAGPAVVGSWRHGARP